MKKLLVAAATAAILAAGAAQAATPAVTLDNVTGASLGNPPFTLGWSFSTNNAIVVDQLGLFDDAQDGLLDRYELGLWDDNGALIASATLGAGTSGALINQFRYVDIADVALAAGATYYIGALYLTGNDPLIFPGAAQNFATMGDITFGEATFASGSTLARPTSTGGAAAYFGPNFTATSGAVPEPGTWALMILGFGTAGAVLRRSRQTVAA